MARTRTFDQHGFGDALLLRVAMLGGALASHEDIDPVIGKDEAAGTGLGGDGDRDGAHALGQHGRHEA